MQHSFGRPSQPSDPKHDVVQTTSDSSDHLAKTSHSTKTLECLHTQIPTSVTKGPTRANPSILQDTRCIYARSGSIGLPLRSCKPMKALEDNSSPHRGFVKATLLAFLPSLSRSPKPYKPWLTMPTTLSSAEVAAEYLTRLSCTFHQLLRGRLHCHGVSRLWPPHRPGRCRGSARLPPDIY